MSLFLQSMCIYKIIFMHFWKVKPWQDPFQARPQQELSQNHAHSVWKPVGPLAKSCPFQIIINFFWNHMFFINHFMHSNPRLKLSRKITHRASKTCWVTLVTGNRPGHKQLLKTPASLNCTAAVDYPVRENHRLDQQVSIYHHISQYTRSCVIPTPLCWPSTWGLQLQTQPAPAQRVI